VLQRLLENKLFVKEEKCEFHVSSVGFLGYILESGQVRADPAKIQAVVEWLQRFLGFANFYRRFIRDYSRIAAPLTKLTSPAVPFSWTPEAGLAFAVLKERFTSAPILVHPDPSRQFIMEVDASDTGVGRFSPNALVQIRSSTLVPFCPIVCRQRNATTTWATVSCWW